MVANQKTKRGKVVKVKEEKLKIYKMMCKAMSGKLYIKKSDFADIINYLTK